MGLQMTAARKEGENERAMTEPHNLDIKPTPEKALYINEPEITGTFCGSGPEYLRDWSRLTVPETDNAAWYAAQSTDHIRVYVPLDLSKDCILAYFRAVLAYFGRADERNEAAFSGSIDQVITRLEIYDQVRSTREISKPWKDENAAQDGFPRHQHSRRAADIARVIVDELRRVADDGCSAECFPYEIIDTLCREYGFEMVEW